MYQKYKDMFFVVSSRDFVILSRRIRNGNTMWIVGTSIEHPGKPPVKSTVRGDLKIGGWLLEEKEGVMEYLFREHKSHM
jgi:LEA14-like dessication related protein